VSDDEDHARPAAAEPDPAPETVSDRGETGGEAAVELSEPTRFRMRRAPRYRAFGFTGVALGIAAGVILALSFKATSDYSIRTITGYFAAMFALVGGLIGLGLAVLIERRRS
jgi:hypothetical protein